MAMEKKKAVSWAWVGLRKDFIMLEVWMWKIFKSKNVLGSSVANQLTNCQISKWSFTKGFRVLDFSKQEKVLISFQIV